MAELYLDYKSYSNYQECTGFKEFIMPNIAANILYTVGNIVFWLGLRTKSVLIILVSCFLIIVCFIAKCLQVWKYVWDEASLFGECYLVF